MHIPVLAEAALEWLQVRENGIYVDCTAGAGGHSERIAKQLTTGRLIAIDRDPVAVALSRDRLEPYPCAEVLHGNYSDVQSLLAEAGVRAADGILIDAGVSSMQLDTPERGFTFQEDGPLDMRMDTTRGITAADYLATVSEEELAEVLYTYGDLKRSRSIAAALCAQRLKSPMLTTRDLADAIAAIFDFVQGVPVETRTIFQAIRIAVNEELRSFERGIRDAIDFLAPGGRFVGITFHSGEDRILKNVLRDSSRKQRILHPDGRLKTEIPPITKLLTSKPVLPTQEEIRANPRAHSAKLRAVEKLAT